MRDMGDLVGVSPEFPESQKPHHGDHFLFAARTKGRGFGFWWVVGTQEECDASVESDAFPFGFSGRMAVSIAADGTHSDWQNVAQVAGSELHAGDCFLAFGVAARPVFPRKGHRAFGDSKYASIGDGGSANISAQIFNDAFAIAEGLEVHTPILFPNRGIRTRQKSNSSKRTSNPRNPQRGKSSACSAAPKACAS